MHVLIVEDNAASLELAKYLLQAFGHSADGAASACEGLAAARNGSYDLVLADIQMQDTDGYAFARGFKSDASLHSIPLVALTAMAMAGDRNLALEAGFDEYVPKPIDPVEFVPLLERLVGYGR